MDFPGGATDSNHVSWDEWFEAVDARGLNFIDKVDAHGRRESNFFRLENPDNAKSS